MEREKRRVGIPKDWNGITIGMYQQFEEVKRKKLKEDDFNLEILSVICGSVSYTHLTLPTKRIV